MSGNKKVFEQKDMWNLITPDTSSVIMTRFAPLWDGPQSLVLWSLMKMLWPLIVYQLICSVISTVLSFGGPFFLFHIVNWIASHQGTERWYALFYMIGLWLSTVVKAVVDGQVYFTGRRVGNRMRAVLIDLLYQKSLKRANVANVTKQDDDDQASVGKIVTLMSVDTEQIRMFVSYWHEWFIVQPLSVIIALVGLYNILGLSAFAGVATIVALIPIGSFLGNIIRRLQMSLMKTTDARVTLMNELLNGIRIIKYFAWERHFIKKVNEAREKELNNIFKLVIAYVGFYNIGYGTSILVAFITFAVYTLVFKLELTASIAFTSINLLNVVSTLLGYLPMNIMRIFKAKVSIDRIQDFLKEKELEQFQDKEDECDSSSSSFTMGAEEGVYGLKNAQFSYYGDNDDGEPSFILKNLDIQFPLNQLTLVVGSTGSGKSSLLLSLLGEMNRMSGTIQFSPEQSSKSVAYVAQTAWLLNATIRDNILFGEPYDEARYERVLRDCALVKDLQTFAGGDLTEIGEKGINLSGGQKQRISLARACYSRSAFVLLDDPLSAVDAPTARHLLHRAILGSLRGRTCVLVSHYVSLVLPHVDYCAIIKNGELLAHGSPHHLINDPSAEGVYGVDLEVEHVAEEIEFGENVATSQGKGSTLVQAEEKSTGSVRLSVYRHYIAAAGGIVFICCFIATLIGERGAQIVYDWWLKYWTDHVDPVQKELAKSVSAAFAPSDAENIYQTMTAAAISLPQLVNDTMSVQNQSSPTLFYLGIYAALGLVLLFVRNLENLTITLSSYVASKKLHNQLLEAVIYSPLRFFEVTPIGRVLNRFSKDIESIDNSVMQAIEVFIERVFSGLSIIVLIGSIAPIFLVIVPPTIIMFVYVAKLYVTVSRDLKRLESISRSPIYAQFSETLNGVATIRAYRAEDRFVKNNRLKVDTNHESFFFIWAANRWLCLRIDFISATVVLFAGVAILVTGLDSGWAALTITYALQFTQALLWAVRFHAEMEMSMNSMERVQEYTRLEQEPPAVIEHKRPGASWPAHGGIQVKDLSIRYDTNQPDVLKKVTFDVKPHEKVAVVGRTGAGKSTLSLAFFRILPMSSGSIVIDDVDISEIGLFDLRSRLTIIPQDPVLFTGSIRTNLDPFEERTDQDLWEALNRVDFAGTLQTNEGESSFSLEYPVSENGSNFSQGQRQLLCLARALLRKTRIVFLDEATASVDNETDARIQKAIREDFKQGTVITIAHRLRTIIDYDKVLVLDRGQVIEFGSPADLLALDGVFKSMCEETGEYQELYELAQH